MLNHFADRGLDLSAVTPITLLEAAIVKATDYVDKRFSKIFKGDKTRIDQFLEWPRLGVFDTSGFWISNQIIPSYLKKAIAEYALLAYRFTDLLPVPSLNFNTRDELGVVTTNSSGSMTRKLEKVGPITEDITFASPIELEKIGRAAGVFSPMVSSMYLPEYPVADEWLKQIVKVGRGTQLARA
jgi:hypothetical protein